MKHFINSKTAMGMFIALLFAFGFYVRLVGIINNSFAYTYDVGRDLLAVRQMVVDHKLTLIGPTTGLHGVFYGPWWYIFLSFPFVITGGNPQGISLAIALTGMAAVLLAYYFGKKVGGRMLGLIFAISMAISSMLISTSSQIWSPNLVPFLLIILLVLVHNVYQQSLSIKKKNFHCVFILIGIVLGLIPEMGFVFGLTFFLCSLTIYAYFYRRLGIKNLLAIILGFILIQSPKIIFELRHNFLMTNNILMSVTKQGPSPTTFSFSFNPENLTPFWFLWKDTVSGGDSFFGLIFFALAVLGLVIAFRKIKNEEKFYVLSIFFIIFVYLIIFAFVLKEAWGHYLIGLPVLLLFLISIIIKNIIESFSSLKYLIAVLLIVAFWINIRPLNLYDSLKKPLWEGNSALYRNQLEVVDYIYTNAKGDKFNYSAYTPPIHDYTYRYLFSWYGQNKYRYLPSLSNDPQKKFFFIIEPDLERPFLQKKWLDYRINDGKVIKQEKLKSGIIIQTRQR